jgi:hypothetical protein
VNWQDRHNERTKMLQKRRKPQADKGASPAHHRMDSPLPPLPQRHRRVGHSPCAITHSVPTPEKAFTRYSALRSLVIPPERIACVPVRSGTPPK